MDPLSINSPVIESESETAWNPLQRDAESPEVVVASGGSFKMIATQSDDRREMLKSLHLRAPKGFGTVIAALLLLATGLALVIIWLISLISGNSNGWYFFFGLLLFVPGVWATYNLILRYLDKPSSLTSPFSESRYATLSDDVEEVVF
jgi:hypothetical protein